MNPFLQIIRALEAQQTELELKISATPTGPTRVVLTDANIHLGEAIRKLRVLTST